MLEFQKKSEFDFLLLFLCVVAWVIGLFLVFSATHIYESGPLINSTRNQIVWVSLGLITILIITSIPTRLYYSLSYVAYGLSLLLLFYGFFTGVISKGAERWIVLGGARLQPAEFAKIGVVLALARYFSNKSLSLDRITSFFVPCILIIVPFGLIIKQPDLGSALILCAIALPVFYWAGLSIIELFFLTSPLLSLILSAVPLIMAFTSQGSMGIGVAVPWGIFFLALCTVCYITHPPRFIVVSIITLNLFTAGITTVVWNGFLQDYQKKRILSFINPQADPSGAGYQVIQSKVAIGSGHLVGKGYLKGTQTRLSFLPEQHTDFIFSVLGEQFGMMGCVAILLLFLLIITRGYMTTQYVKNRFSNLVIVGSVSLLAFHIFVNVSMTIGMMPVVGVPLPFLSYGGSFTLTIAILVGFILNARYNKQDF
ncbi:MAG TPA: rod shape-determining protein RodA [Chitinivibrionales bacterium]